MPSQEQGILKIIFFGSDDFALAHLEALLNSKHEVICCVTGPDKPQGRGMKMTASPIKALALEREIPCLQPASLKEKEIVEKLKIYGADIFVVVAYGRLLTQEILDIPKLLCMNVHGSLLPKYRGAAPINWAIMNGDQQTGVTLQKMVLKLDAGDVIAQEVMNIGDDENAGELRSRMASIGAKLLVNVLDQHPLGQFPLKPQHEAQVTYASKMTKEMGRISWDQTAVNLINQIRGLQPWPGVYTVYNGKMFKIIQASLSSENVGKHKPGEVLKADKNGLVVACADGALAIGQVQPEAGKMMPAASFIAGYKIAPGIVLGS